MDPNYLYCENQHRNNTSKINQNLKCSSDEHSCQKLKSWGETELFYRVMGVIPHLQFDWNRRIIRFPITVIKFVVPCRLPGDAQYSRLIDAIGCRHMYQLSSLARASCVITNGKDRAAFRSMVHMPVTHASLIHCWRAANLIFFGPVYTSMVVSLPSFFFETTLPSFFKTPYISN
jgi:hypothetical protein